MSSSSSASRKLRVLCLHGYRQSGQSFRTKTGAFRKMTAKKADFEFITAPWMTPPVASEAGGGEEAAKDEFGWWFSQSHEGRSFEAHQESDCQDGFEESVAAVQEAFREKGPFDGVLAFSQGAALLVMLCLRRADLKLDFRFGIFVAPFRSRSSCHQKYFDVADGSVDIPTLHVIGDADRVIERPMSDDVLRHFAEPVVLRHAGGHFMPATSKEKKTYMEFLQARLEEEAAAAKEA